MFIANVISSSTVCIQYLPGLGSIYILSVEIKNGYGINEWSLQHITLTISQETS